MTIILYGKKITTNFWAKPTPKKYWDWCAWFTDDEVGDDGSRIVGYGDTEDAAVADLKTEFESSELFCAQDAAADAEFAQ